MKSSEELVVCSFGQFQYYLRQLRLSLFMILMTFLPISGWRNLSFYFMGNRSVIILPRFWTTE